MNLSETIFDTGMKKFNKRYKEYSTLQEHLNSHTKKIIYIISKIWNNEK